MIGFIRRQEIRFAMRLLTWQYEKKQLPMPSEQVIRRRAEQVVEDAHRITKDRGKNVAGIMKDLVADIMEKASNRKNDPTPAPDDPDTENPDRPVK